MHSLVLCCAVAFAAYGQGVGIVSAKVPESCHLLSLEGRDELQPAETNEWVSGRLDRWRRVAWWLIPVAYGLACLGGNLLAGGRRWRGGLIVGIGAAFGCLGYWWLSRYPSSLPGMG